MPVTLFRTIIVILLVAASAISISSAAEKHPKKKKPAKALVSSPGPALPGPSYAQRSDAMQAADMLAKAQHLDTQWVRQALAQARYIPAIAKAVTPPAAGVAKNWRLYRSRIVEPIRIRAGVRFWQTHTDTLLRAESETGVPREIIVGILGVETIYGQQMGRYRVLDALTTLAFDFPASHPRASARSAFFMAELGYFLSLMQQQQRDPGSLLGSYAGAIGLPQFMPSSWTKYAVDYDGDGHIDLLGSPIDAIGSVANYLKAHGWQKGLATHYPVYLDAATLDLPALLMPDIVPTFSQAEFRANGALLDGKALQHSGKLALIELQNGDDPPSFVAGTDNFFALTRYNWSSYYALAVIELGLAVRQAAADPN